MILKEKNKKNAIIPMKTGLKDCDFSSLSFEKNKLDKSFLSFSTTEWNKTSGVKATPKRKLNAASIDRVFDKESRPFASK